MKDKIIKMIQCWGQILLAIKNITVLGSGVMGHGIAQVSATAGYNVKDIEQGFLDKAMEKIKMEFRQVSFKEKFQKKKEMQFLAELNQL